MGRKICLFFGAMLLLVTTFSLQACFENDYPYNGAYNGYGYSGYGYGGYESPYRRSYAGEYSHQAEEEQELEYGPTRTVCDRWGNNCMVCDADNDYCRRTSLF
jgi:hypothetical protein